ncbi:hypothetical protein Ga0074812_15237 [Parafrankia irregularis]|uniref:DUF932 domain-containing protein n=1 Tax=Parafrankia irregularis TaxID=795642 RepID=A0A0S4R0F4_9ACTN|nr:MULTISPECIES: DUF932 domain-containing protein [Parafrankia]MBE3206688.1 DUF932 domain-containing protein [Parafrankia sp. CH37]CUU61012.1 hypothetical protein Ga0074812_15237 [Parafrankia irregularis]
MAEIRSSSPTRNADLEDLIAVLRGHHARKVDVVAPVTTIRAENGRLVVTGTEPVLTDSGVTLADGVYLPTAVADEGLSDKLGIPLAYLRRLRTENVTLYDENINSWLRHEANSGRRFLVRTLRNDDGGPGVARAVLSDRYRTVDHLDVLMAALDGVHAAGAPVQIDGCDLTDRRMYVRVRSEAIRALAPTLLEGYRSPFSGDRGEENPVVWAGFQITNSETGCGAFTISPRLVIEVCRNGMTIAKDALRAVHLGGRLEQDGVVQWSADTQRKAIELITAKARDAVTTFLDIDYVKAHIERIERKATRPIEDPAATVQLVSKHLQYSDEQQALILRHFIRGGDPTAGGILNAVTSAAQTLPDADVAHDMEAQALRAMEIAART